MRGGALFNGKEGRGDFRKKLFNGKEDGVILEERYCNGEQNKIKHHRIPHNSKICVISEIRVPLIPQTAQV